jgi:hypothetical protein
MLVWRWVFLALYLALLASVLGFFVYHDEVVFAMFWLGILLGAQALFVLGAGTIHLCRPIRKRRLFMPVVVASLMFTVLFGGLGIALLEYFKLENVFDTDEGALAFWATLLASWVGWGFLMFAHTRDLPRFKALSRLSNLLIAGSLAELLAAVPAHVVVTRRPGCLVGLGTLIGIVAGLSVMTFSFGPAVVLLFLRPRYRREQMEASDGTVVCEACGYDLRASRERCPECGTAFPSALR